jgi:hypothetical protein
MKKASPDINDTLRSEGPEGVRRRHDKAKKYKSGGNGAGPASHLIKSSAEFVAGLQRPFFYALTVMGPDDDGSGGADWTRAIADCLDLDNSDTDNGKRLIRYFGHDLLVLAQEGVSGGDLLAWSGTCWDWGGGAARAAKLGQKVGDMIELEAAALVQTKGEAEAIAAGETAAGELKALIKAASPT